mmetsp:Transcript_17718/g.32012  ORF Transcript_17718/g.32012 Transcript_17718/m.32012 type:complete len:150 (+) Transcript_17718:689-1138(+)
MTMTRVIHPFFCRSQEHQEVGKPLQEVYRQLGLITLSLESQCDESLRDHSKGPKLLVTLLSVEMGALALKTAQENSLLRKKNTTTRISLYKLLTQYKGSRPVVFGYCSSSSPCITFEKLGLFLTRFSWPHSPTTVDAITSPAFRFWYKS